ncbi:hypothetical protein HII13_005169 [Brettanomyces bruxellensis]|nr:hypothetical protein HII13_005169 [Brettanomyces bruxellensis]
MYHSKYWVPVSLSTGHRPILRIWNTILPFKMELDSIRVVPSCYSTKMDVPKVEIVLRSSGVTHPSNKFSDQSKISDSNETKSFTDSAFSHSNPNLDSELVWICPICFLSNTLKLDGGSIFNIKHQIGVPPKCGACGVTTTWNNLQKSTMLAGIKKSQAHSKYTYDLPEVDIVSFNNYQCPRCTFVNHPSMVCCEMCGTALPSKKKHTQILGHSMESHLNQSSNGKYGADFRLEADNLVDDNVIKLSFRLGGEHNFYNKLYQAIKDLDWESIQRKNGVNRGVVTSSVNNGINFSKALENVGPSTEKNKFMRAKGQYTGISSLQSLKRAVDVKKGTSTYKVVYNLYLKELSRHICEFLIEEDILEKRNGLITLYELYALYNEACGFGIATPKEVLKAILLFSKFNFNYVITEIPLTKKEESTASMNIECTQKVYIISYKKLDSSSVIGKILQILSDHPGLSILQIQQERCLQISFIIIESLLNEMLNDGILVIDKTLQGEFFYPNKILSHDDSDSAIANRNFKLKIGNKKQKNEGTPSPIFKAASDDKSDGNHRDDILKELAGLKF